MNNSLTSNFLYGLLLSLFLLNHSPINAQNASNCTDEDIQNRLDEGESPFEIFQSCPDIQLSQIYGKYYLGKYPIAYLDTLKGNGFITTDSRVTKIGASWVTVKASMDSASINVPGTSSAIGTGVLNTALIIAKYGITGSYFQDSTYSYAALLAYNYSKETGGNWFLPSSDEMAAIVQNVINPSGQMGALCPRPGPTPFTGSQCNFAYWTSTQQNINPSGYFNKAYIVDCMGNIIPDGEATTFETNKSSPYLIRLGCNFSSGRIPQITSISPDTVRTGENITVTGLNFNPYDNALIFANGVVARSISSTTTSAVFTVPDNARSGQVKLTISKKSSFYSEQSLTILPVPEITSIPSTGMINQNIIISGKNFSSNNDDNQVTFSGVSMPVTPISSTENSITVTIPLGTKEGFVHVISNGIRSTRSLNKLQITPLNISLNTTSIREDKTLTITGNGFSDNINENKVYFTGGAEATPSTVSTNRLTVTVPKEAKSGTLYVISNGVQSINSAPLDIIHRPEISYFTPQSGSSGELLTITANNLEVDKSVNRYVIFYQNDVQKGSALATYSNSTTLQSTVPQGLAPGKYKMSISIDNWISEKSESEFTVGNNDY
ncbi:IPT/TIG domain-containing protein [Flammeovirga sp. SubArs3]|uniref:IPT/TIG domain-containing protein n=1 Tax=Flammeovirga sp. SubArs3 TaxID=2995316 RepID=UPI00248CBF9C|nr:IPT/TIG domain-containing protein [Flammeovirga sp. SubArs3]